MYQSFLQNRWAGLGAALALGGMAWCRAADTNVFLTANSTFSPATVTIQVGDTVTWINQSGFHTVTGDGADPFCGSGFVQPSCSKTFTTAGTFPYHCNPHVSFGMRGTIIVQAGATNVPPTVSLVAPTNGAAFTAPAAVDLEATANDADGTIARVDFFSGTELLGSALSFPYRFSWALVPAGAYQITARARDNLNAETTSTPVSITVVAVEPIAFSTPVVAAGSITLSWSGGTPPFVVERASDPGATSWEQVTSTSEQSTVVTRDGEIAFYRIRSG